MASTTVALGPLLELTHTIPIVFVNRRRPGRRRLRRKPGTAGWQRHRIHPVRIWFEWEMAGVAQEGRTTRATAWASYAVRPLPPASANRPIQAWHHCWMELRPIRIARPRRDRARHLRVCARAEWRSDRDGERASFRSSRADHHARGTAQLPAVYPYRFFVTGGGLIS